MEDEWMPELHESVLVFSGPLLYEARILQKRQPHRDSCEFLVEYLVGSESEWVNYYRVLELSEANVAYANDLARLSLPDSSSSSLSKTSNRKRKAILPTESANKENKTKRSKVSEDQTEKKDEKKKEKKEEKKQISDALQTLENVEKQLSFVSAKLPKRSVTFQTLTPAALQLRSMVTSQFDDDDKNPMELDWPFEGNQLAQRKAKLVAKLKEAFQKDESNQPFDFGAPVMVSQVPDDDPRIGLRGQKRLCATQDMPRDTIVDVYRGLGLLKRELKKWISPIDRLDFERYSFDMGEVLGETVLLSAMPPLFSADNPTCLINDPTLVNDDEDSDLKMDSKPKKKPKKKPKVRPKEEQDNVDAVTVTWRGWPYVVIVTNKFVKAGQELLLLYGKDCYWGSLAENSGAYEQRKAILSAIQTASKAIRQAGLV